MSALPRTRNSTAVIQAADAKHHFKPFTDHKALAQKGVRVISQAEGCWLTDSEGVRLLDGMAGLWSVNIGYGRKELAEAAHQQLLELPYYNSFFQTTNPPVAELGEKLAEVTPEGIDLFAYGNSGSDANDTIVKLVRYFWNLKGKKKKKKIISRQLGYHGVTLGAASLSGLTNMHPQFDLPLPNFVDHVASPYWYRDGGDKSPEEFGIWAARELEKKIQDLGPENVGAFIGEPIQGAGGVIIPPASYWPEIQRICAEYDVLLIADEVICGFGRTGQWFGSDTFGIKPDFMTMAKGLTSSYIPMSAVGMGGRVADAFRNAGEDIAHGFTYSGHPVAAAVAVRNLEIMQQEKLIERCGGEIGPYFQQRLRELAGHKLVGEVRGVGLIAAIELVEDKASRSHFDPKRQAGYRCRTHSFANGLVMRAVRDIMVLSPPLTITREEVDTMVGIIAKCLDLTAHDLGR